MKREIRMVFAAVATIALPQLVQAADIPVKAPIYKAPVVSVYNWTGCYVGAEVGYAWERDRLTETVRATGALSPFTPRSAAKPDGAKGGGYLGCNWQGSGAWVFGLEADAEAAGLRGRADYNTPPPADFYISRTRFQGSVRGRIGYAVDHVLFYATGGIAVANISEFYAVGAVPALNETFRKSRSGWTAGAGFDYAFGNNWIGRLEYRYANFGTITDLPVVTFPAFTERHKITESAIRLGLAYRFDQAVVARY